MRVQHLSDEDLLAVRVPGDAGTAFAEFYRRHERMVLGYHVRRCHNAELATDLTAETFMQVLASRDRFKPQGEGTAIRWLYGIAANVLSHHRRRSSSEQRKIERLEFDRPELDDARIAAIESTGSDDALNAALEALPVDQREAIRSIVLGDDTYESTAQRLDVPAATVRKRVSRGLHTIRRSLERNA